MQTKGSFTQAVEFKTCETPATCHCSAQQTGECTEVTEPKVIYNKRWSEFDCSLNKNINLNKNIMLAVHVCDQDKR